MSQDKHVYFFGAGKAEGKAEMKKLLGGKGANLAEMTNLGIPVPPGFTITTDVCRYYYNHGKTYPADLDQQIEENLAKVEFRPEGFYFPAGGASVYHIAAPGEVTLARFTRSGDTNHYKLTAFHGEFVSFGKKKNEEISCSVQDNWPHTYVKLDCSPESFIDNFNCNHIHGTYGNWIDALKTFCFAADVEFQLVE